MITSYSVIETVSAGSTFFSTTTSGSQNYTTFQAGFVPIKQSGHLIVLLLALNWSAMPTNPLDMPDLPLFQGENPDVQREAREVIGEWWLTERNSRLGGRTPNDVIAAGQGARVRNIIRSLKYISAS